MLQEWLQLSKKSQGCQEEKGVIMFPNGNNFSANIFEIFLFLKLLAEVSEYPTVLSTGNYPPCLSMCQ